MSQTTGQRVRCGRHSGIPGCCIAWYTTVWRVVLRWERFRCWTTTNGIEHEWHRYHDWRDQDAGYVQCPVCKLRRRYPAPVRSCACGSIS